MEGRQGERKQGEKIGRGDKKTMRESKERDKERRKQGEEERRQY